MGIISLNEKRSGDNKKTTGKEVSFFTSDQFGEILVDPQIIGKFYFYHDNGANAGARFGAFWDNGSTLEDLLWQVTTYGSASWYEKSSRWNTTASQNWSSFKIDLSSVTSPGRLVIYAGRQLTRFGSDTDIDDIELLTANGSTINFDPSDSDVRSNNLWERFDGSRQIISYTDAKNDYPTTGYENIPESTITAGKWNYVTGPGGTSSNTGSDNAADNNNSTKYLYWEGSAGGVNSLSNSGSYIRWKDRYNLVTGDTV